MNKERTVEVGVAEVRSDEGRGLNSGGGESERVDGPEEVGVPVDSSKGKTLSDRRLRTGKDPMVLDSNQTVSGGEVVRRV